ncbi:MAG TPA: NUDIX domain-containing protein [Streptosporangiaceae bacterium]|nr:NUDIX domain-containing protein [Streptosporangiaceae bacterium]
MTVHDGNGWTRCGRGHRHWGRHGAAGLLLAAPDRTGQPSVLLQQRSWWGSYGGAWGPPGGARDSHESVVRAALREAAEECAIDPAEVTVHGVLQDDHGGWTYQTVLARAPAPLPAVPVSEETKDVAWVPVADVELLNLHPGFAGQWAALRTVLSPLTVVVDAANVVGSRPDGWWRDRAGAARRLCDELAGLASRGVTGLPESAGLPALQRWFPQFVVVLEGAASEAVVQPQQSSVPGLRIVRASGSGDDEIVRQAAELPGVRLVVTADRELRARCEAAGAAVTGPRWLLSLL